MNHKFNLNNYSSELKGLNIIFCLLLIVLSLSACSDSKPSKSASVPIDPTARMQVFKSPTCQCCNKWVSHLESAGFSVATLDSQDLNPIKEKYGISPSHQSCHTGVAGGYIFEGHIPAPIIQQFLSEKPGNAIGLSVPGMPIGSPGMEMGDRIDDYDVIMIKKDGSSEVYQRIRQGKISIN